MRTVLTLSLLIVVLVVVSSCSFKVEGTAGNPSEPEQGGGAGETTGTETAAPPDAGVEMVALVVGDAQDEAGDKITNETTKFTPNTPVIYAMAAMKGLKTGDIVTGRLMAVKVTTSEGKVIENYEALKTDIEAPGAEATTTFDFSAPDAGWPVGSYQIVVDVGGKSVGTVDITVESSGV